MEIANQLNEEAQKLLRSGQLFLALDYSRDAISRDSKNASFYYTQALIHFEFWKKEFTGKKYGNRTPNEEMAHARVLTNCRRTIEYASSEEEKAKAYHLMARQVHDYWDKEKMFWALSDIKQAVELAGSDKEKAEFLDTQAQFHYDWEEYRESLRVIDCAIKLDPQNPRLRGNRKQVLKGLEGYHWPRVKKARKLKEKGELSRARAEYNSVLRLAREVNNDSFADLIQKELDELNSLDKQ